MNNSAIEIYPVSPVEVARPLGFYLGTAVECTLCAPYRDGVEDCDRALEYLALEDAAPQQPLSHFAFLAIRQSRERLTRFLCDTGGDLLWLDISRWQTRFLAELQRYLSGLHPDVNSCRQRERMANAVRELRRVLAVRDTPGQMYEGMTGLPETEEARKEATTGGIINPTDREELLSFLDQADSDSETSGLFVYMLAPRKSDIAREAVLTVGDLPLALADRIAEHSRDRLRQHAAQTTETIQ